MMPLVVLLAVAATLAQLAPQWTAFPNTLANGGGQATCIYAPGNVVVSGGTLKVYDRDQVMTCSDRDLAGNILAGPTQEPYTTGRVMATDFRFTYGTAEVRMKHPGGWVDGNPNPWPAAWFRSADGSDGSTGGCQAQYSVSWAKGICQIGANYNEIDFIEFYASPTVNTHQVYNPTSIATCATTVPTPTAWHTYLMIWSPGRIVFYLDGLKDCTITDVRVPSVAMFPVLQNLVYAGTGINPNFPLAAEFEYLRIWDTDGKLIFDDEFDAPYMPVFSGPVTSGTVAK